MNDINTANTIDIIDQGYECLLETLGTIGTERFISTIIRERFDYTKWRREQFGNESIEDINAAAVKYAKEHPFVPAKKQIPIE